MRKLAVISFLIGGLSHLAQASLPLEEGTYVGSGHFNSESYEVVTEVKPGNEMISQYSWDSGNVKLHLAFIEAKNGQFNVIDVSSGVKIGRGRCEGPICHYTFPSGNESFVFSGGQLYKVGEKTDGINILSWGETLFLKK